MPVLSPWACTADQVQVTSLRLNQGLAQAFLKRQPYIMRP